MAKNIASGSDRVPVQAGQVKGRDDKAAPKRGKEKPASRGGKATNTRTGDATVGLQADEIVGDVVIGQW